MMNLLIKVKMNFKSEKMFEKIKELKTLLMMIKKTKNQKDTQFLLRNSLIKLKA